MNMRSDTFAYCYLFDIETPLRDLVCDEVSFFLTSHFLMQIATFNVRTLNRIGQQPDLTASAIEHNIICIQEHRCTHSEDIKYHDTGNGWTLAPASA